MIEPFGYNAFAEFHIKEDHSIPNPFYALMNDPDSQFDYLIELYPYDETKGYKSAGIPAFGMLSFAEFNFMTAGGERPVYLSNEGFTTEPTDTPSSQHFLAQVDNPLSFETSILSNGEFGGGNQSFGAIYIANGNGELDYLENLYWSSRRVVVKAGIKGFPYAGYSIVFDGVANDELEGNDDGFVLTIRDNRSKTDNYVFSANYLGTGGAEGGADLANKPKPMSFGSLFNIEPILVDSFNLVYQFHDGSALAVDKLRDAGIELINDGDVANIITAPAPAAGHYITQLSGGYIKLGATPAGRITADVRGDNAGGFVSAAPHIVERIVKTRLGIHSLSDSEVDSGALNILAEVTPGATGVFITEPIAASQVVDQLIFPLGAYWTFSRIGLLTVGEIKAPTDSTDDLNLDNIEQEGMSLESNVAPAWRISVGYKPSWTLQGADELAGATTDETRDFVSQAFRYVTFEDTAIRAKNIDSRERVINTYLTTKDDADALLARLVQIYSVRRKVYEVTTYRTIFRVSLGDAVNLTYDRFGLNSGKNFLVVGEAVEAETGAARFRLWG